MTHSEQQPTVRNSIVLLREREVPATPGGATFRYSRATAGIVAALMLAGGGGLLAVGRLYDNPFAYYISVLLFVFLWIYQTLVLARFRETNWLVRIVDDGLYIKFRSYLNHHFPADDRTVVYVPYRAMRTARHVRETQEVPDTDGRGTITRRRTVVEIELKEIALQVEQALADERRASPPKEQRWYGSTAGKYRHHPVRLSTPQTLAIEWGVRPGVAHFLSAMAVHTPVESAEVRRDYTVLGSLERNEQESRLLELAENGQLLDAVRLARLIYGYDLSEAKRFVDGLAGRAKA
jgi:hypothetical protein